MNSGFAKGILAAWAVASIDVVLSSVVPLLLSDPQSLSDPSFLKYQAAFWTGLILVLSIAIGIMAVFLQKLPLESDVKIGALFGVLYALPLLTSFVASVLSDVSQSLEPVSLSLGALSVLLFQLAAQIGAFVLAAVLFRRFADPATR